MTRNTSLWAVLALLAAASPIETSALAKDAGRPTAKAPPDRAFQKAKKEYQQRAHGKKPAERVAALKLLEDFPTGDAADLVYVTLLDDKSDDVRRAAVAFLAAMRDREDAVAKLLQRMTNTTRKDGMDLRAVGALRALAGGDNEGVQGQLLTYLDEFLGTPRANLLLLNTMIDDEASKGDAEEVLR